MIIIILKKQAHKGVIVSIILMWLPHCLKRIHNWKFRGATISLCWWYLSAWLVSDNFEEMLVNVVALRRDTLPYSALRAGSPTVSIQKLPVFAGACHVLLLWNDIINYAMLSVLFMKTTNIKVLYTYIRLIWAGQCGGWWHECNQLVPSYVQLSKSGEEVTGYGTLCKPAFGHPHLK